MPLNGITVAVTSSRRAWELAHIIKSFGGKPYLAPTVGIDADLQIPSPEVIQFLNRVTHEDFDYIVFMTAPGVFSLFSIARKLGIEEKLLQSLLRTTIIARSSKPKMALKKYGVQVSLVPDENTATGVSKLLLTKGVAGKKVAVLQHGNDTHELSDSLYDAGSETVIEASTYRYSPSLKKEGASILKSMGYDYVAPSKKRVIRLIHDIVAGNINSITFTSPPSAYDLIGIAEANHLLEQLKNSLNRNVVVVAVGPSTRSALEKYHIKVDVMPQTFKMGPMIKALEEYIARRDLQSQSASRSFEKM
ncbi:MAG: uroporphyrinogen-III synthase [Thermoproteota archaeon]|jgi:uroporphyrinogen-III synthase|nr:uroporphyrinogen-III synthase [Thermoproteota archaeon]